MTGDDAPIFNQLHQHKAGTPTMGGWLILLIVLGMVLSSFVIQYYGITNNSLFTRQETYIILFALFSMWGLGLLDDYLNIRGKASIRWLTANMKLIWMFAFSAFISYWFYRKLGIDYINIWPLWGERQIGRIYPLFTFFLTVAIVNAINITDGLDGLVGGLMLIVLGVFALMTFINQWYLATTVIGIVLGANLAFLRFNINPAKIFLGDSWALALGGLVATLTYLLNITTGIILPFMLLFLIFWIELGSSFLQIVRKKWFHKKLFSIAPYHHLLEHTWQKEHTIVMKFRVVQGILAAVTLICIIYQFYAN
jgi:phospho-N-acetylmuramoyl-pentapeptide-transferase